MKMICEVPDEVIKCIKDGTWCGSSVAEKMIANGIPLSSSEELCEDAISRQAVIDGINEYFHDEYYQRTSIQDCRDCLIEDVIKNMPSVTPQPKSEWQQDHEILKAYSDGANDVLDEIKADIEQTTSRYCLSIEHSALGHVVWSDRLIKESEVLEIIDKYMAERGE